MSQIDRMRNARLPGRGGDTIAPRCTIAGSHDDIPDEGTTGGSQHREPREELKKDILNFIVGGTPPKGFGPMVRKADLDIMLACGDLPSRQDQTTERDSRLCSSP